jgi:hypothetical protein
MRPEDSVSMEPDHVDVVSASHGPQAAAVSASPAASIEGSNDFTVTIPRLMQEV